MTSSTIPRIMAAVLAPLACADVSLVVDFPRPGAVLTRGRISPVSLRVSYSNDSGSAPSWTLGVHGEVCMVARFPTGRSDALCAAHGDAFLYVPEEEGRHVLTFSTRAFSAEAPSTAVSVGFTVQPVHACAHTHACLRPASVPHALLHTCAVLSRFTFYLYSRDAVHSPEAAQLYYALRDSPFRTMDARTACVFIVVSDIRVNNVAALPAAAVARELHGLEWWGASGERHVIFDFADYDVGFDYQHAIMVKSSYGAGLDTAYLARLLNRTHDLPQHARLRPQHDIVAPMPFYRCNMGMFTHLNSNARRDAARSRLLVFKGALYNTYDTHPARPRQTLRALHNGQDVIVALTCWSDSPSCAPCTLPTCVHPPRQRFVSNTEHPACARMTQEAEGYNFTALLETSLFAAVIPGEGTHSYRLYEALQAGSVPVLLGESAAPLPGIIDWPSIAVIWPDVSLQGLTRLVSHLRSIPAAQVDDMRERGMHVFHAHFATLQTQVTSILAEISDTFKRARSAVVAMQPASVHNAVPNNMTPAWQLNASAIARATANLNSIVNRLSASATLVAQRTYNAVVASNKNADVSQVIAALTPAVMNATVAPEECSALTAAVDDVLIRVGASTADHVRRHVAAGALSDAYGALSAAYTMLGYWRLAFTAAGAAVTQWDGESADALMSMTGAVRRALIHARSAPLDVATLPYHARPCAVVCTPDFGVQLVASLAGGYGTMASFLPVAPLTSIQDIGATLLPLSSADKAGVVLQQEGIPKAIAPAHVSLHVSSATIDNVMAFKSGRVIHEQGASAEMETAALAVRHGMLGAQAATPRGAHDRSVAPTATIVSEHDLQRIAALASPHLHVKLPSFLDRYTSVLPAVNASIAIVSMCAYNDSATSLKRLSLENLNAYCTRHRYACFVHVHVADPRRPPAWSKLLLMAEVLPQYDWILWRDCDSFFMNSSVSIQDVIASTMYARSVIATAAANVMQAHRSAAERPTVTTSLDMIISEDALMLNSGVWLLRNCPWSVRFLLRVYGVDDAAADAVMVASASHPAAEAAQHAVRAMLAAPLPYALNTAWEQGSIFAQLAQTRVHTTANSSDDDITSVYADVAHTQFVPQAWINAYPPELAAKLLDHHNLPLHAQFEHGDWIISFSGCKPLLQVHETCEALYARYASTAA